MASIVKRGKTHCVVYYYTNTQGIKRQKWETFTTKRDAKKRKAEVEYQQSIGTFIPPSDITVHKFLKDFIDLYGTSKWGFSAYDANVALIRNYVDPILGEMCVQDINKKAADSYVKLLQKTKPVEVLGRKPKSEYITSSNIDKIVKLLRCAFRQAMRWDIIGKNPFDDVLKPKVEKNKRQIWTVDIIVQAMKACTDPKLYVAINLAFACSLRMGEITGLTWDCVHVSDADIAADNAHIWVTKELARVSQESVDKLGKKDIILFFPKLLKSKRRTLLVLKKPKTESSIRQVWIPQTLAYILRSWKENQDHVKALLGSDYSDFNLVVAQENGRPCEDGVITNQFRRLKKNAQLPNVVFHSLRHSSATYKLKITHGDIKATQGDTGHAQADMVTEVYSHIIDEDRKVNAQKFDLEFYSRPDLRLVGDKHAPNPKIQTDVAAFIEEIRKSPELAAMMFQAIREGAGYMAMQQLPTGT